MKEEIVMATQRPLNPETIVLHGGYTPDRVTGACSVPIYQSASYVFADTQHAARLFALEEAGNIYTRIGNPTVTALENRIAELEGGVAALATASGMSAITLAILTLAGQGDEIVASESLYGGTITLFDHTFKKFGIKVKKVNFADLSAVEEAISEKTKAIYAESIGNPKLFIPDFEKVSAIAKKHNVPFVLDNTTTPFLFRPFDYGVDIIVYSLTKYIGGHGTSIGGIVVDKGSFDWNSGRFANISSPDKSYHGVNFFERFGKQAFILKARCTVLRDIGPALSPFNAFLFLQGLESLHVRLERHVENARIIAERLEKSAHVAWVNYPGLASSSEKKKADTYFPKGPGAIIGFGIKGGREAGERFINELQLIYHLANIGDSKTLAIHPASTTHQQLTEKEQIAAGVTPDFIRLSVGIEHVDDIWNDLEQALEKAGA